ncbi:MAG: ATP-grasp domain-containing protein [Tepidisphaerales bacterium]
MPTTQQPGKIKWLFERNVFSDGNPEKMVRAVQAGGMQCAQVGYVSAGEDGFGLEPVDPVPFSDEDPVMVYGSMNLCRWLLCQKRWPRLAWYDFDRLRCQSYYAQWGEFLLQREYAFMPLAELYRRHDWVFRILGRDGTIFVRPDDNDKSFSGGPVQRAGFQEWYKLANFYDPGPDCLVVVSSPEAIHSEWRSVIGQRQTITGSLYRQNGAEVISSEFPTDAADFAARVANATAFDPHPIYVMDVCSTADGYRLVEIGSMCAASLYACDVEKVVRTASRIVAGV